MHTTRTLLAAVLTAFACLSLLTACATSNVTSTWGPLVAEVAQARIASEILERHPDRAPALLAVASALDALADEGGAAEVTETLIAGWVAQRAPDWGLTPPEQALLSAGLVAARDAFLRASGAGGLSLDDPRVRPWIAAISRGITAGVAARDRPPAT